MTVTPFPYTPDRPATPANRARTVLDLLPDFIELAGRISRTEFVPTALRNRPEAVLAALMSGAERGLGPMESLRSVHIIEGRPTLSAEAKRALVLAAGHDIELVESTPQRATVVGRRAGSEQTSPPFTWTIDRARKAGLLNKTNWQRYPEAMLLARASSDLCTALFPDVIAGLDTTELVVDELEETPAKSRRAPARRPLLATGAPVPAPELAASAPAADVAEHDLEAELLAEHPTWAPTPVAQPTSVDEPTLGPHDAGLARRIHASIAEAFPDTSSTIRDRRRHALSILATRKRPDGPIASSAELDLEEQLRLSNLLERIKAGTATVTDAPDGTVEIRGAGGGWNYAVTLEPPAVTSWQGEPPGAEGGSGVPTPGELPLKGST